MLTTGICRAQRASRRILYLPCSLNHIASSMPHTSMASSSAASLVVDADLYRLDKLFENLGHINRIVKCVVCLTRRRHDSADGDDHSSCLLDRVSCCLAVQQEHDRGCDNVLPKKKGHLLACTECGIWEVYHLHTAIEFSNPPLCPWVLFKNICFCLWHDKTRRDRILPLLPPGSGSCLATFYRAIISGKNRAEKPCLHSVVSLIARSARGITATLDYDCCVLCGAVLPGMVSGSFFDTGNMCVSCFDSGKGMRLRQRRNLPQ